MDQQPVNNPDQPPVTPDQPVESPQPPVVPSVPVETFQTPEAQPVKKSHKKLFIIGAIVAVIVIAILGYLSFGRSQTTSNPSNNAAVNQTDKTIDDSINALTTNNTKESSLTNTDDSKSASDASTTAGNVGGSVNENDLK